MQNTLLLLPSTNRLQYQYQGLLFFIGQFFQSQGTRETMSTGIQQTRMRSLSTPPVLSSSRTPLPLIRSASTSNIQDGQATRPVLLFQRPTEYTQEDTIQVIILSIIVEFLLKNLPISFRSSQMVQPTLTDQDQALAYIMGENIH
jgi:hypothetical protein